MAIFMYKSPLDFTSQNVLAAVFIQILLFPFANSIEFQISRFSTDETRILYEGDAVPSVGAIEFNRVDYINRVGRAIYSERVLLWDSGTRRLTDFATHFTFTIDTRNITNYGHGLVFFLAPVGFQIPPNSGGGFLGLFNTTTSDSPRNQIVAVEFDSFSNDWDPQYEHVGIINNSIASSVNTPWNASLHSGDTADAWIIYNATSKNLSVFWSYGASPNSSLSYQIDLMEVLPEWVTVGFSAATGMYVERHILLSWEFNSNLAIEQPNEQNARKIGLIVGLTVSGCFLIAAGIVITFVISRKRRQPVVKTSETVNSTSINYDLERGAGPRRFIYKDLALATNNFSNERKLGQGGFGEVYKGHLVDLDKAVAVKKISRGSRQGQKEYITEVKIISRLRHRNLVQLIGWCHDQGEFLLVYEFMPNGSLDVHLFGKKDPLSWALRYKITLGLASALLYLHEEWEQCVIHRDIKASNIMLDSNFNVKLGDFGLARLMDHELGPQTTDLAGTLGYLAPEYISTGRASKESDVYSFGVVALEIACGRKSSDTMSMDKQSETGLVEGVWNLHGRGELLSAVDDRLLNDCDPKQLECLLMVGLWCSHPDRTLRPSIRQAIQVLHFEAALPQLPTQIPVPIYHAITSPIASSGEPFDSSTTFNEGR